MTDTTATAVRADGNEASRQTGYLPDPDDPTDLLFSFAPSTGQPRR